MGFCSNVHKCKLDEKIFGDNIKWLRIRIHDILSIKKKVIHFKDVLSLDYTVLTILITCGL